MRTGGELVVSALKKQSRLRGAVETCKRASSSVKPQEPVWKTFLADPPQWCDNRSDKKSPDYPDFRHITTGRALLLDSQHGWMEGKLRPGEDAGTRGASYQAGLDFGTRQEDGKRVAVSGGDTLVAILSKYCDDVELGSAVEALDILVQQGGHYDNSLFYHVLKRCMARKDLALGRRVHALSIKGGHEGNAFLANHVICMYASHQKLEDAMQVFNKVTTPNSYMWASIILAHARSGQPVQAMELYRRMRESNMNADSHMFVAVLKACATAGDLSFGKKVHADILGSAVDPDMYVGNCLVDMYAKCGSLGDARRVFDNLPSKDAVTWNAMITGYSQHGLGREALDLYSCMQQEGTISADRVTFACLLQACASIGALPEGKHLHAQIHARGLEVDVLVGNALVDMYAKCRSLAEARALFDRLPNRNVVTWTTMIAGYTQVGLGREALNLYSCMQKEGITPANHVTYVRLLQACASIGDLGHGRKIHVQIQERGLEGDPIVGTSLVDMYAKCGSLLEAQTIFDRLATKSLKTWNAMITGYAKSGKLDEAGRMFDSMTTKDVVTWNTMIAGYAQHGLGQEALAFYGRMQKEGMTVADPVTFVCLLQACADMGALHQGKQLHACIHEQGLEADKSVGSCLVKMYAKCGSFEEARGVFDRLPTRDVGTWNAMIAGYAQHGLGQEAFNLYETMKQEGMIPPDAVTFVRLLQACASLGALHQGKLVHSHIQEHGLEDDVVVGSSLASMYAKCGSLADARAVFDRLPSKNVVTWNAMITGYAQHALGHKALALYQSMQHEGTALANAVTFIGLLQACGSVGALHQGKQLHSQIRDRGLEEEVGIGSTLVDMYTKCGSLEDARRVFDRLPTRDTVIWNAMIVGYAKQGLAQEAFALYERMQREGMVPADAVTFVGLLQACASNRDLHQGNEIHAQIQQQGLEADLVVGSSLVNMYAKCGRLADAQAVFDSMPVRDLVTWSAMIAGYSQHGLGQDALALYERMRHEGMLPHDAVTFVSLLQACSSVGALHLGKELHSQITERGLEADVVAGSSLVNMYAKCGSLVDARKVFDKLPTKDVVTWTALLNGYAEHSNAQMAMRCFEEMQQQGVEPSEATFTSLLVACSHGGLVNEGQRYFNMMVKDHGIVPNAKHYNCMVDLLGRSGHLNEAEDVLLNSPHATDKDVVGWTSLLTACRSHGDLERGRRCFDRLIALEPGNAVAYVLLGNIYAQAGRWKDVDRLEALRKSGGASKKPANACIEVKNKVLEFTVGEERPDLSSKLRSVNLRLKLEGGHVPHTELILKAKSEQEKEDALCGHAEKLALAYGLLNTADGTTLLVTKNLRMCDDCHSSTKIMSRLENREIIVRDAHRVHRFMDGSCSCGDGH